MPRLAIRSQPLGLTWRTYGTDLKRGIRPEDFQCTVNQNGCLDATWTLRRDPYVAWPDLNARTPIEVDIAGFEGIWSGRIRSAAATKGDDSQIQVQAEGWQFATDDRPYTKTFVRAGLSDWTDARQNSLSLLAANEFSQNAQVSTGTDGSLVIGFATNLQPVTINQRCGFFIDLGPNALATTISIDLLGSANSGSDNLYVRGMNTPRFGSTDGSFGAWDALSAMTNNTTSNGTYTGTFSTPVRYIVIFNIATASYTPGGDSWWKFTGIRVATSGSYLSSGVSVLKASDVLKDGLARTTMLDQSTAGIQIPTFSIPTFAIGQQTPREAFDAANSFQDYQWSIGANRKLVYRPKPTSAILTATSRAQFDQATSGDASNIYNEVTYTGTGPDGTQIFVTRTTALAGLPQTVMDKRGDVHGFTINSNGAVLTAAAASQLCDVFLQQRNRTPLKGKIRVSDGRSIALANSVSVPPVQLLRYGGELLTLGSLQDPDTGRLGRDGRIAQVTYTHATDSATIDIDSTPGSFEAVVARLAVVTSG